MNTLYIIRGFPGSGKSTLASEMAKRTFLGIPLKSYPHFEADMFFYDKHKNYKFDVNLLGRAHNWCYTNIEKSLYKGFKKVFVSNTSTRESDINTYIKLAVKYNYKYVVITVENWHNNTNVHNVPNESIEKMKTQLKNSIKL